MNQAAGLAAVSDRWPSGAVIVVWRRGAEVEFLLLRRAGNGPLFAGTGSGGHRPVCWSLVNRSSNARPANCSKKPASRCRSPRPGSRPMAGRCSWRRPRPARSSASPRSMTSSPGSHWRRRRTKPSQQWCAINCSPPPATSSTRIVRRLSPPRTRQRHQATVDPNQRFPGRRSYPHAST